MRYIVDRILDALALCEDEEKQIVPISLDRLPHGLKEGDILQETGGVFSADPQATAARRRAMQKKLSDLFGE